MGGHRRRGDQLIFQSSQAADTSLFERDVQRGVTRPLVTSPANEQFGVVSPDGRWIAYSSDATGQWEIYVETFPKTGERWRISNEGGHQPRFEDGGEVRVEVGGELHLVDQHRRELEL